MTIIKYPKEFLSSPGPNRFLQSLVPLPIICQNFVFDLTNLKKTRFTIWGISIPVSSMSIETAISSGLFGSEKSSINDCT